MIGNQQSVPADKAARPSGVEAHRGFLQVVKPRIAGIELVTLAQQLARRLVEEPHPFVSRSSEGRSAENQTGYRMFHDAGHDSEGLCRLRLQILGHAV